MESKSFYKLFVYQDVVDAVLIPNCSNINSKYNLFRHAKYSIEDQWPEVKEAPEPSVILWKNLKVGGFQRFIRTLFVALVTVLILACSVTGIIITKYY